MGIIERRENEKRVMRENILDAALHLCIEKGFNQVSIRNIADKIQYSPSNIYLYFKDKNSIIFELHNQGFIKLYEKQQAIQHITDPVDRLIAHAHAYLQFSYENRELYDIMFLQNGVDNKLLENKDMDLGERSYDLLRQNISECMQAGYFKDMNIEIVSFYMWSLVHGMATLRIRNRIVLSELCCIPEEELFTMAIGLVRGFIK